MQNDCAEFKIRAERKAGELLSQNINKGGDTRPEAKLHSVTLMDYGIEKIQSHRWQKIASIPVVKYLIRFKLFDFGYELGICFFPKFAIRFRLPFRLNHKGVTIRLLDFVSSLVNLLLRKDKGG